jgi:ComF family protein
MKPFVTDLIDFIYPPVCAVCTADLERSDSWNLCPRCRGEIAYIEPPFCARCGRPFAHEPDFEHLCGECITRPRHYRRARAVGHYRGMLRSALHLLKYRLKQPLAPTLGSIMTERLPFLEAEWIYDLVVPVPLHPRRLRGRGFNQALYLASSLSRHLRVPLDRLTLKRMRCTQSQVGLSATGRASNVKGAFVVARPHAIRNKTILLIDDMYTSGSTVDECSRVLVVAGAESVDVLTLARVSERGLQ